MTITHISNTQGLHKELDLPYSDMLICTGGISSRGLEGEIIDFVEWFSEQKHFYKIFIGGGEDWGLDLDNCSQEKWSRKVMDVMLDFQDVRTHYYLHNNGCRIEGVNIYGSPCAYSAYPQAFQLSSHKDSRKHWLRVPSSVDILLTPEAPKGKCDWVPNENINGGCAALMEMVLNVKPKLHLFGGFLFSRGVSFNEYTTFVNGSSYDMIDERLRDPILMNYNDKSGSVTVFKESQTPFNV